MYKLYTQNWLMKSVLGDVVHCFKHCYCKSETYTFCKKNLIFLVKTLGT